MKSNETEHFKSKPVNPEQSTETIYVCLSSFQSENELKEHSMAKHKETRPSSDSEAPTINEQTIQSVDKATKP